MNCPTCDAPIEAGALFCANCGARVTPASSAATPTIVLPSVDPPRPPAPQNQPPIYSPPPTYGDQYGSSASQPHAPQTVYTPTSPPNSNAAVISLVFGILSWLGLVLIGAIVAIVAGHMARNEIRASGGRVGGGGMALAGLLLGYIQLALLLLGCIAFFFLVIVSSSTSR
jgi:uncharacterized protein DUF4190/zinc ribbon protein